MHPNNRRTFSAKVGSSIGMRKELGPTVVLINPGDAPPGQLFSQSRPTFPVLGLLQLCSALSQALSPKITVRYIDAAVIPEGNMFVRSYLAENAQQLVVVGVSLLTSNYPPALDLLRTVKAMNPQVVTIVGNDHFSVFFECIMRRQKHLIDYGLWGNDVVEGFTQLVVDITESRSLSLEKYPGLIFRDRHDRTVRNAEDPSEYARLPTVDYSLLTSFDPFQALNYYLAQQRAFSGAFGRGLRGMTVELARGCQKFRSSDSSRRDRRCSFCAIVPGAAPVVAKPLDRAWETIRAAIDAGFNFLFVTADDLLFAFSSFVRSLAQSKPNWFLCLEKDGASPKFFAYSRADAFVRCGAKTIDAACSLGLKQFFVGFDYFDPLSLELSRKPLGSFSGAGQLIYRNYIEACEIIGANGIKVIGGVVINHLGMSRSLLDRNLSMLTAILRSNTEIFVAIEFGPLCPLPGSFDYEYLTHPNLAESTAAKFGLRVDKAKLETLAEKYRDDDAPLVGALTEDYVAGCCPDISLDDIEEFKRRLKEECGELGIPCGGP